MKKMTKARWAGIGRFVEEARKVLEARGIAVAVDEPFDPKKVDSRFALEAVAMTKFGRLDITVYDWIAARFQLPKEASKEVDCNPHSGKWNLHFHTEGFSATPPADEDGHDPVKECADLLAWRLDRVEATEWQTYPATFSASEIDRHSEEHWERRKAMGEVIAIEGFDADAAKDWIAEQWVVVDGTTSSAETNRVLISRDDDVRIHFMLKSFAQRHPGVEMPDFHDVENEYAL